ncbi:DUF1858 domain-containing protein [Patescibacteria group bacterium]|nr:DUF1858 domain-containing protein [Patescibacteria group bacterium]MBU1868598.1 DUF1858 domain-containing protein [Patescibacteria group bacterium]
MKNKPKLTPETTLGEALKHPNAQELMLKYQFPCLTCPFAKIEADSLTLEHISQQYGIDLSSFLEEINR